MRCFVALTADPLSAASIRPPRAPASSPGSGHQRIVQRCDRPAIAVSRQHRARQCMVLTREVAAAYLDRHSHVHHYHVLAQLPPRTSFATQTTACKHAAEKHIVKTRDRLPAADVHPVDIHKVGVLREVAGKLDPVPVNPCAHSAGDHRLTGRRIQVSWYCCHLMPLSLPNAGKTGKPAHAPLRSPPKQISLQDPPDAS